MRRLINLTILGLCLPFTASAQLLADFISAHPERISPDGPFLLLVKDQWTDGCGGQVEVEVTENQIDVTSVLASPILGAVCTQALVPFQEIINVRTIAPDVVFTDPVTVNYRFDRGEGPEERMSLRVDLVEEPLASVSVQNGGYVTRALESSGLFIDQQGDVLTAFLAEYDSDGLPVWYYASGRIEGTAFTAPMQRFSEIVCVTAPCPRVAPDREGRVDIVLEARNLMMVDFEGVLEGSVAPIEDALSYQRLRFERSESLDVLRLEIPDLVGNWVAGVRGVNGDAGSYQSVELQFDRVNAAEGAIPEYIYSASLLGDPADPPAVLFEVICADNRPLDGFESCRVEGFEASTGLCTASFRFEDVGVERVSTPASCNDTPEFETQFDFFRLD